MNSDCLNLEDLCTAKGKLVWVLYCDLVCLDDDGSVLDVAVVAMMAALKSCKSLTCFILYFPTNDCNSYSKIAKSGV
jgi:exosome complex RNA-binding protein Rrp42 (RNase PH superfamily)